VSFWWQMWQAQSQGKTVGDFGLLIAASARRRGSQPSQVSSVVD
jgi:hypothetical protein